MTWGRDSPFWLFSDSSECRLPWGNVDSIFPLRCLPIPNKMRAPHMFCVGEKADGLPLAWSSCDKMQDLQSKTGTRPEMMQSQFLAIKTAFSARQAGFGRPREKKDDGTKPNFANAKRHSGTFGTRSREPRFSVFCFPLSAFGFSAFPCFGVWLWCLSERLAGFGVGLNQLHGL